MGRHRILILQYCFLVLAGIAFLRLFQLQVIRHNPLALKAKQINAVSYNIKTSREGLDFSNKKPILIQRESAKVSTFLF